MNLFKYLPCVLVMSLCLLASSSIVIADISPITRMDPNGNGLVVWLDEQSNSIEGNVLTNGTWAGTQVISGANDPREPSIAVIENTSSDIKAVAIWTETNFTLGITILYGAMLTSSSDSWTSPQLVSTIFENVNTYNVHMTAAGNILATFSSNDIGIPYTGRIRTSSATLDGSNTWGSPVTIN